MKFDKANNKVKVVRAVDGLLSAIFEHEIKQSTAEVHYTGPKISEEEWDRVLAFFEHSYQTTHSEAQVRLFVNTRLGQWRAWAFPQICGTGMTTKEIEEPSPLRDAQRAQFSEADGWIPFGTVHHHCKCSAFQSPTDEADEVKQDGLHITVGKIGENKYDIHCRFYIGGNRFDPDMSLFWEVGDLTKDLPEWAVKYLPATLKNDVARNSMCIPAPKEATFPEEWKANLIDKSPPRTEVGRYPFSGTSLIGGGGASWVGGPTGDQVIVRRGSSKFSVCFNTHSDLNHATQAAFQDFKDIDSLDQMHELFCQAQDYIEDCEAQHFPLAEIIQHCYGCDVTLEKFVDHLGRLIEERDARNEAKEDEKAEVQFNMDVGAESFDGPWPNGY